MIYVLLAAILLPLSGCLVQDAWKNQLGDVYSLAIGTVCCTMAALAPVLSIPIPVGAAVGCALCCGLYVLVRHLPLQRMITFWMIVGVLIGAIGTIVNNNVNSEDLQAYYRWSSTSFDVSIEHLPLTFCFILSGILCIRNKCLAAMLFTSAVIFVVGPVWTISLLAPNLARLLVKEYTKAWYQWSVIIGAAFMIATQCVIWCIDSIYLPFSASLAILSAPFLVLTYTVKSKVK